MPNTNASRSSAAERNLRTEGYVTAGELLAELSRRGVIEHTTYAHGKRARSMWRIKPGAIPGGPVETLATEAPL